MTRLAAVRPNRCSVMYGELGTGEGSSAASGDGHTVRFVSKKTIRVSKRTDNPESKPPAEGWHGLSKVD
jgi:ribosomal protein L24E